MSNRECLYVLRDLKDKVLTPCVWAWRPRLKWWNVYEFGRWKFQQINVVVVRVGAESALPPFFGWKWQLVCLSDPGIALDRWNLFTRFLSFEVWFMYLRTEIPQCGFISPISQILCLNTVNQHFVTGWLCRIEQNGNIPKIIWEMTYLPRQERCAFNSI